MNKERINQAIISVSELNRLVKGELESKFPNIWIEGELSNLAQPGSGHIYFTLKDEQAQVRCAMFRLQNRLLSFQIENGLKVKVKAKVSLYEGRGDYQLIVSRMIPDGEGALQQAFEALKKQLSSEGLFNEDRKQAIPQFPESIGLITSPTGAVIQDILHVIDRRFPGININIYPTQVQGKQALPHLLKALKLAIEHDDAEVLIIARGGGSLEDLWAFNEEKLARAIYQCPIPIISAVGHETDVTIADFVADLRAPTPSAAAELATPDHSTVLPKEVELAAQLTRELRLNIPLLSAAMDTVTEAPLAIALSQEGGIGIIHKNMSIDEQAAEVRKVKKYESGIVAHPVTVPSHITVNELLEVVEKYSISGLPVVDEGQLVGIVTRRDWRFETNLEKRVIDIMTPKDRLITVHESASNVDIEAVLHEHRLEKLLIVNDAFQLRGMMTVKDLEKAKDKPHASKDRSGRLLVGASVGTGDDTDVRLAALVEAEVDVLVVDTAHGHSQRVIDRVRQIKESYPNLQVIGGNIATAEAAEALVAAGADAVKVGIGPGSICTTRIVTGVGVPQITAIQNVAEVLKGKNIPLIADGGIRYSGDIAKAIAAGADTVMVGSAFAGTEEAPGEVVLYQGRTYKSYRGMGSIGAMKRAHGSSDRYFQEIEHRLDKLVPEGIEARVPYKGSMLNVVHQMIGGLRSSMGYTGCKTTDELREHAQFVRVTNAGVRESHVHDVIITEEAPNYRVE